MDRAYLLITFLKIIYSLEESILVFIANLSLAAVELSQLLSGVK